MPEARLQRTREAYEKTCGHPSIVADRFELVTDEHGHTSMQRIPQRCRVRGADAYWCYGCDQLVDRFDDLELFKRGIATCPRCGTTGRDDCPSCGALRGDKQ